MSETKTMRLAASGGALFEMAIEGYEFPEHATDKYDSNWLEIRIRVVHRQGEWSSKGPYLLTFEVEELAAWFEAIAQGQSVAAKVDFIEPDLAFRLSRHEAERRRLRVYFSHEFSPPWQEGDVRLDGDVFVEFPLSDVDLSHAAGQLRECLARYPQRAGS